MKAGRLRTAALPALTAALAGCGQSSRQLTPAVASLPLVGGARIVAQVRQCDSGANAFCAWQLVVADPRAQSSDDLLISERRHLKELGWTASNADTGEQRAADSPGHKLRVTYATAEGDLKGIDLGWIRRSRTVTLALSRAIFTHDSTLSMLLEHGTS